MKTGSFFAILGCVLGVFTLGMMLLLAYWALDRRPPVNNVESHFVKWDEERSNLIWIKRTGVRVRQCHGEIYQWLIGSAVIPLQIFHIRYPEQLGLFEDYIAVEAPDWAKQIRIYRASIRYICNPIHNVLPIDILVQDVAIMPRPGGTDSHLIPAPPKDTSG